MLKLTQGGKKMRKGNRQMKSKGFPGLLSHGIAFQKQPTTIQRRISIAVNVANNSSSIAATAINAAYMRANAQEWSNLAALYTEYRILKTRVKQLDIAQNAANTNYGAIVACTDRSGVATTPSTPAAAYALEDPEVFNMDSTIPFPWVYTTRALDLEEQNFTAVGVNATTYQVFVVSSGGVPSGNVYSLYIDWIVEFRSNI
jgi:hypothetical protein